jgi:CheY-like chemotaxis protein
VLTLFSMVETQQTLLLVEDDRLVATATRKKLQRQGFKVITALNGQKAVDVVRQTSQIDLILMDIDLGEGMDGIEAASTILNERSLPVLFLSGHTEPEIMARAAKIPSYGYVIKNSGDAALLETIASACKSFKSL